MRSRWVFTSVLGATLALGAAATFLLSWASAFPLVLLMTCVLVPASFEQEFRTLPRPQYWPELTARLLLLILCLTILKGDLRAWGAIAAAVVTIVIFGKTVIVCLRR
jgi:hypothetical protein